MRERSSKFGHFWSKGVLLLHRSMETEYNKLLTFTRTLFPRKNQIVLAYFILCVLVLIKSCRQVSKSKLKLIIYPISFCEQIITWNKQFQQLQQDNIASFIFVNLKILNKWKVNRGSWIKVAFDEEFLILAQVLEYPGIEANECGVSPELFHNLKQNVLIVQSDFVTIQPILTGTKSYELESSLWTFKYEFLPLISTVVKVAAINMPWEQQCDLASECLSVYFKTTKYLTKNDLFTITNDKDRKYFKVISIQGPEYNTNIYDQVKQFGYIVKTGFSTLYQLSNCQSIIPKIIKKYIKSYENCPRLETMESNVIDICPTGLKRYCDELVNYLTLCFTSSRMKSCLQDIKPLILIHGPEGCGKRLITSSAASKIGVHFYRANCLTLIGDTNRCTEAKVKNIIQKAITFSPCVVYFENVQALQTDHDGNDDIRVMSTFLREISFVTSLSKDNPHSVVFVCSAVKEDILRPELAMHFIHTVNIQCPNASERKDIMDWVLRDMCMPLNENLELISIAENTAGCYYGDLVALVTETARFTYRHSSSVKGRNHILSELWISQEDMKCALDVLHSAVSDSIGAPKIPKVKWDDIGGLNEVKSEIIYTIKLPLQFPSLMASGLRRSGVLLYGPPGTGKTLLAKAVATEFGLNFLSVKGPELLSMYVGQSEENVRDVFAKARSASPCIIFFDELDSLAPVRGKTGDSGGVMDRVVSQLLAELDGMDKSDTVFVIGATNRPDLIDPALLRPGRFDKLLYIGISTDAKSQESIVTALTGKFNLSEDFNMSELVSSLPVGLTGADLYALCADAVQEALGKRIQQLEEGLSEDSTYPVIVTNDDFLLAAKRLVTSVTPQELKKYDQLRKQLQEQS